MYREDLLSCGWKLAAFCEFAKSEKLSVKELGKKKGLYGIRTHDLFDVRASLLTLEPTSQLRAIVWIRNILLNDEDERVNI